MENEALFQYHSEGRVMDERRKRTMICPNCSGIDKRQTLATATSRNIVHDDTPITGASKLSTQKLQNVIKLFCQHCGHELTRKGGRI
jgi:hypothetical protein